MDPELFILDTNYLYPRMRYSIDITMSRDVLRNTSVDPISLVEITLGYLFEAYDVGTPESEYYLNLLLKTGKDIGILPRDYHGGLCILDKGVIDRAIPYLQNDSAPIELLVPSELVGNIDGYMETFNLLVSEHLGSTGEYDRRGSNDTDLLTLELNVSDDIKSSIDTILTELILSMYNRLYHTENEYIYFIVTATNDRLYVLAI